MQIPNNITLNKAKNLLTVDFNGIDYKLTSEYLRVYSPSAEVRGHAKGQEVLQLNKQNVTIKNIKPTGNYAIIIEFDDGHNTGIYSWDYLYDISINHDKLWGEYLHKTIKSSE